MSPLLADSVAKRFWAPERRKLFYIKPDYGILIQDSDYSDSNIARFQRSGEPPATFATLSALRDIPLRGRIWSLSGALQT
jgi:hypothetical protein